MKSSKNILGVLVSVYVDRLYSLHQSGEDQDNFRMINFLKICRQCIAQHSSIGGIVGGSVLLSVHFQDSRP